MPRSLSVWCTLILAAITSSPAPAASAVPTAGGIGPGMVSWVAGESYGDGTQSDPRLDQPVAFWGAGIPLKEVFASLREQAGVEIGFWPAADDNERICVNLYLNPDRPPTLRELMVQLSWVTDCAFALSEVDEEKRYALLATTIKHGAVARMQREQEQNVRAYRQRVADDRRKRATEKMAELRDALTLSREELIDRYKDRDDLLLLAMLDPAKRDVVEFVLGLLDDDMWGTVDRGELRREWDEWSAEQQGALTRIREQRPQLGPVLPEKADRQLFVHIVAFLPTLISISFERPRRQEVAYFEVKLADIEPDQAIEDRTTLGQLLGEEVSAEEAEALRATCRQRIRTAQEEREKARLRTILEDRLAAQLPLSPRVAALLSSISLGVSPEGKHPLWQIQEAVAARSGMHVVSDCFWQPARSILPIIDLVYPDERPEMTALLVLRLACLSTVEPEKLRSWHADNDRAGWEWQDVGTFFRFRHKARDLWRLAFLPERTLSAIDSSRPADVEDEAKAELALDLRKVAAVIGGLNDAQVYQGGKIIYHDPADPAAARSHAVRETVFEAIGLRLKTFRFLATLSDEQRDMLESDGLRWREDLTPDQQEMDLHSYFAPFPNVLQEATLRLEPGGFFADVGGHHIAAVAESSTLLILLPEGDGFPHGPGYISSETGEPVPGITLPRRVVVDFEPPSPLTPSQGE